MSRGGSRPCGRSNAKWAWRAKLGGASGAVLAGATMRPTAQSLKLLYVSLHLSPPIAGERNKCVRKQAT